VRDSDDDSALDEAEVVVRERRVGREAGLAPTLASVARTLDISIRFLGASLIGKGSVDAGDRLLHGWSRDIFRYANASLTARGLRYIQPGAPYVVMSNHASLIDVPALIATYPGTLRMVTKEELMRVPIWGRAMKRSGFIPVNRGDRARAIQQLEIAKQRLREGIAVWIAPEGTRGRDTNLGPFKKGGFHLARQLGVPILPAYVDAAATLLPSGSLRARHDVDVSVTYGPPIPTSDDIPTQIARVRAAILELAAGRITDR